MGKDWDSFKSRHNTKSQVVKNLGAGMRQTTAKENLNFMYWTQDWATEALRVLKPGGTALVFAGSRTQHLVAMGIEQAGFILKDCIMWLYGCLSEDTEVLTERGWRRLYKTTEYDRIRIYDITNNIYKWETPKRWSVYSVNKDTCYQIKSDKTDQIVSKEHRCIVEREGKLVFKRAYELDNVERVPVLPQDFYYKKKSDRKLLFKELLWKSEGLAKAIFSKRQGKEMSSKRIENGKESSLEGRSNLFQKEGKLWKIQNKICSLSRRVFRDGSERRICNGTQIADSSGFRKMSIEDRGDTSQRPQSREQRDRKPNAVQEQQRPQTIRSTISKIEYTGRLFCPTVSTGAFVARRNGKVFITGNSGFPKATDISKQLDKVQGRSFEKQLEFTKFLRSKKGKYSNKELDELLELKNGAFHFFALSQSNNAIPRKKHYLELKYLFEFGDEWDTYIEEAEREVIGQKKVMGKDDDKTYGKFKGGMQDITLASTPQAKLWNGWKSHGLKPAYEPVIWATKPLTNDLEFAILEEVNNNLISTIWQSLIKLEKMDMSKLLETASIHLNTVLLWNTILNELLKKENKSIISTESKTITELKILNSLLLRNTLEGTDGEYQTSQNGIQKFQVGGLEYLAKIVESYLEKGKKNLKDIQKVIVREVATYKRKEKTQYDILSSVENVEKDLFTNVIIANSVLKNVITNIEEENNEKLKPNYSPIIVAMKSNDGSYAQNALKHGVSGLNIDGGRIDIKDGDEKTKGGMTGNKSGRVGYMVKDDKSTFVSKIDDTKGRFPANIILDEEAGKMLDEQSGESKGGKTYNYSGEKEYQVKGFLPDNKPNSPSNRGDKGGASRFFYVAKASKAERNAGCEGLEEKRGGSMEANIVDKMQLGGASLKGEHKEIQLTKNNHPTVKPIKLMEYLCTLTKTPTGGIVLDPFMGSGSTGLACQNTDRDFIGIEREEEYVKIAEARLKFNGKQEKLI